MMNTNIKQRVQECIALRYEGNSWDFKREWYQHNHCLLHDIICMANLGSDEDGIIIIGVDEENGYQIHDVINDTNRKNTQKLVDFLKDKSFASGIRPEVRVESIEIDEKTIDVIVVKNTNNTPYYLTKDFDGGIKAYHIYTRVQDTNTPRNNSADINMVEALWKKRFGIDKTIIQRFQIYLQKFDDWDSIDGEQSFFHKTYSEFKIETEIDENKSGYEYYCFSQMNPTPRWYNIRLLYHQTIINDNCAICLDGGRFFTAVPDFTSVHHEIFFYSYTKGSFQYDLTNFFLNRTTGTDIDSKSRWYECIPVFNSFEEKNNFINYLSNTQIPEEDLHYKLEAIIPSKLPNGENGEKYRDQYKNALGIIQLLEIYRKSY